MRGDDLPAASPGSFRSTETPASDLQIDVRLLDLTLDTPEENLALDEALLLRARGRGGEILRLWESPVPFVVLGVAGRLRDEVDVEAARRDGIPVLRRASGGGTVLQGPGCLDFALVLSLEDRPELRDVTRSYVHILETVAAAVAPGEILQSGTSDLPRGAFKVSGNAQKRTRDMLVHHGTLLYDFDIDAMARYLREPERQPDYRRRRPHGEFVRNLPVARATIAARLALAWDAVESADTAEYLALPDVARLVREKYADPAWTERF